jgi:hypothetical protein
MKFMNARALVLVLLAGCATQQVDLSATQAGWQGAPYDAAVAQWGTPTRSTLLADGRDARTWVSDAPAGGTWYPSIGVFGGSRGMGVGTSVMMGQSGAEYTRCERTLFFRDGRVVEQLWQGPPSYCSTFRRN